jgi:hypothetical protein
MKIAMMTRWNVPSGQSAHAEPLGHALCDMGHDLTVFAPKGMDLALLYQEDEPYVNRCYMMDIWGERTRSDYFFDPQPFLEEEYEVLLVEDAEIMPMPELLEIFPQIKRKAKTMLVVHETGLPQNPDWYRFDWDAVVCFDKRYKEFLTRAFPEEKIVIIPFPCHPVMHGDKNEARNRLGLPLDRKIVFAYGYDSLFYHIELVPMMDKLSRNYPIFLLLLTHHATYKSAEVKSIPEYVMVKEETPKTEELYTYLHASDAYINYGRDRIDGVGVSSSVATCLGAGRPVLVYGYCNFFELCGKEAIKYNNFDELEQRLRDVFEDVREIRESLIAAERYVNENSSYEIAKRFTKLIDTLK